MVDLKKEIKLSDLVRRKPKPAKAPAAAVPARSSRQAKGKPRELVGVKVGATQISAAVVSNNGHAHLRRVARQSLPPGIIARGRMLRY